MVRISRLAAQKMFGGKRLILMRRKKPSFAEKAANLVKSTAKHVADGMKEVDDDELQKRLGICNECEFREGEECTVCGCPLIRKALWNSETCPKDKWEK
jgi:hypothetical protein